MDRSVLEAAIGRGNRQCADVIESAWRAGARFDLWDDIFNCQIWQSAFAQFGMDFNALAQRQFDPEEILPWEHLGGPAKQYLLTHHAEAVQMLQERL
jgi:hypothetical protein